jgi:hypothetical protein
METPINDLPLNTSSISALSHLSKNPFAGSKKLNSKTFLVIKSLVCGIEDKTTSKTVTNENLTTQINAR